MKRLRIALLIGLCLVLYLDLRLALIKFYPKHDFLEEKNLQDMPLFQYTPHYDENCLWVLGYIGPKALLVQVREDTPRIRQDVLGWIRSKGVEPTTHTFVWKVNNRPCASLTPTPN